jgi:uncharacterized protein YjbI with pentapeptide repeats
MSIHTNTFSGRGKPPLTRSDVKEQLKRVRRSEKLNLVGADLRGSDLSKLRLRGANLSFANLSEANLNRADLSNTSLLGANLSSANLKEAHLDNANLRGTHFSFADLSFVDLNFADLSFANLSGTNLSRTNFSGANLSGSDLSRANLSGANLSGADLNRADLSRTDLSGTDLSGANLLNADLKDANVMRAHFFQTQITFGPELLLQSLGVDVFPQEISDQKNKLEDRSGGNEAMSALRLRIHEDPLTVQHLSATLDALNSLYVKAWLLQQHRFDDFVRYTEQKDRRFEEEANLCIAELKYNSPADIKFKFDFSPKAFIEALQLLLDAITQTKLRIQAKKVENRSNEQDNLLKEEKIHNARLDNADHMLKTAEQTLNVIEKLCPGVDAEQKMVALQSLMKDMSLLATDQTLEISLLISSFPILQQNGHVIRSEQEFTAQTSENVI